MVPSDQQRSSQGSGLSSYLKETMRTDGENKVDQYRVSFGNGIGVVMPSNDFSNAVVILKAVSIWTVYWLIFLW